MNLEKQVNLLLEAKLLKLLELSKINKNGGAYKMAELWLTEPVIISLLNGHVVKLPSYYLC